MAMQNQNGLRVVGVFIAGSITAAVILWHIQNKRSKPNKQKSEFVRIQQRDLLQFSHQCLVVSGSSDVNAQQVAEVLVAANVKGIHSHGVNRLELYCDELLRSVVAGQGIPFVIHDSEAVALVDGNNLQGAVVGNFCMQLAMSKAQKYGIALITARNTCHFGIAGYYSELAAEQGLIGLCFTNTSPVLFPTHAAAPAIGTNPIACAAQTKDGVVSVDLATPTVALGKIEIAYREGNSIPVGWGVDKNGLSTTNPSDVLFGGGLVPLGGDLAGHKGYSLAVMVEMLTGVLSGSNFGRNIGQSMNPNSVHRKEPINLGQSFIAIDPSKICEGYGERLQQLCDQLHSLPSCKGAPSSVLIPGEPEAIQTTNSLNHGVPIQVAVYTALLRLGENLHVDPPACL
eukprot:c11899_g1_i2.p1 GENE.c11899_g1_i2~~c11899_g1_i2.p1  ORF type:complete len:399 (-),score=108.46 c11899_g1_i2:1233-2429(-)